MATMKTTLKTACLTATLIAGVNITPAHTSLVICKDNYAYQSPVAKIEASETYMVEAPGACPKCDKLDPAKHELALLDRIKEIPVLAVANTPAPQEQQQAAPAETVKDETTVRFKFDTFGLSKKAVTELDEFTLSHPKDEPVDVFGYTCWIGERPYNKKLSSKRAKSVARYLEKKGIKIRKVVGEGMSNIIDHENPAPNRRVEIKTIQKKGGER